MAAKGIEFPWRWDGGTISTNLDGIWEMSVYIFILFVLLALPASASAKDSDGDGLSDQYEISIGTHPFDVDTDCDNLHDNVEVGDDLGSPLNADGDDLPDAVESQIADNDQDGISDQFDSSSGWQISCARFSPAAVEHGIHTAGNKTTTLEIRASRSSGVTKIGIRRPSGISVWYVNGDPVQDLEAHDDGTHGDLRANDGIFTQSGISFFEPFSSLDDIRAFIHIFSVFDVMSGGAVTTVETFDIGLPDTAGANADQANNDGDGTGDACDDDDDNDGIPDSFETANGLNPLDPSDANQDADGDGFTNLREFRAGTDPNDPTSVPTPIKAMPWLELLLLDD